LAAEFTGEFDKTGSQFVGAKFSNGYTPAIKAFQ
jgi:hypothetical protein